MNTTSIYLSLLLLLALPCLDAAESPKKVILRAAGAAAEPRVDSTAEQRAQIVTATRSFEKAAFRVHAATERETALWTIDHAPDIFPRLKDRTIADIADSGVPDWRPIYAQFILGFVSFQLENPGQADDPQAVYRAAFESCLRVYRQAVQRDAANRIPLLDAISERAQNGTLQTYIETLVAGLQLD